MKYERRTIIEPRPAIWLIPPLRTPDAHLSDGYMWEQDGQFWAVVRGWHGAGRGAHWASAVHTSEKGEATWSGSY